MDNIEKLNNTVPWKVYPNAPSNQEESKDKYGAVPYNAFGAWRFDPVCLHFKPDIVIDVRDYWMYAYQETSPCRPYFKWVVMPTVDSAPQKDEWLQTFAGMDLVVPYTDWAKDTLEKQCQNALNIFPEIANAGVDLATFKPAEDKKALQQEMFGEDVEITGCVMRNQKRKLFPNVLKAYRAYLNKLLENGETEKYKKSYLYLHTSYPESGGWDLGQLLIEHDMLDKTYFTNMCLQCRSVAINKFHHHPAKCSNCNNWSLLMPNAGNSIDTEHLASIYQFFDFFLQVAICEGFGMPQVEAAACGVPIASVDYSAMTEIVRKLHGYPIPVQTLFRELETGADRAYPDDEELTNIIYHYFHLSEKDQKKKSEMTRQLCEKYYSWDLVADVWDRALSSINIEDKEPWDCDKRPVNVGLKVPPGLGCRELVEFVVNEIILEPALLKTSPIQKLISDYEAGWSQGKTGMTPVKTQDVIKQLEVLLRRKEGFENVRTDPSPPLFGEKYLNVNK